MRGVTSQRQVESARARVGTVVGVDTSRLPKMVEVPVTPPRYALSPGKRLVDVVLAVVAVPVVVPVVVVAGLVSMVKFRTWPLFFQERRGLGQRPFRTMKLRSLPRSFPEQQGKHGLDVSGQGRWSLMLRRSHVDELPQIFNVLGGSMSIVGPRPMIDEVLCFLDHEDRVVRASVRPGLTGPWQVTTAGARPLHDCPELDAAYVRECSFGLDMRILWWTVLFVSRRRSVSPQAMLDELSD